MTTRRALAIGCGGTLGFAWTAVALRAQMTAGLDREVATLAAAGIRVIRVEPGPEELDAMGPNFMDLSRRDATLAAARKAVPGRVASALEGAHA